MHRTQRAFSLIEVAIAVGIVGVTVVGILGLLAALSRRANEARERQTAAGMADAIAVELRRQVGESGMAAITGIAASDDDRTGLRLVACRDGTGVRPSRTMEQSPADQYFLIEVRRFSAGQLVAPPGAPVVPVRVMVSWPYRPATSTGTGPEAPETSRARLEFTHALSR